MNALLVQKPLLIGAKLDKLSTFYLEGLRQF
jgi:hypothetical protein